MNNPIFIPLLIAVAFGIFNNPTTEFWAGARISLIATSLYILALLAIAWINKRQAIKK